MIAPVANALRSPASSALHDARVEAVIAGIRARRRLAADGASYRSDDDASRVRANDAPLTAERGELMYLLCRALRARCIVDAAASSLSALYLAAAVRDNGGGRVVAAGIASWGIAAMRQHLRAAGLDAQVEIRVGDLRESSYDLGDDIDFARIGGGDAARPSFALRTLHRLAPQMQGGAIVLSDSDEDGCRAWLRDPANGFRAMNLPFADRCELAVRTA